MSETVFQIKVDEFLARKIRDIIRRGSFRDEDDFFKGAIEEMVRIYELRELGEMMDMLSRKMAIKHPISISDSVLAARAEEDDEL
jgi:Arc/MetJ-type ribon-helix-helix transcriptional regulator